MILNDWLMHIAQIQPQEIILGLERVHAVAARLNFSPPSCPIILIAGTNGKGSCAAALEKIYLSQGYQTGVFTSPILYRHNELLRIQGKETADSFFVAAYEKIEDVRKEIKLTPFEYHTLAVLEVLHQHKLDLWILEVGLGGRLDAVNIMDADLAIVTSIGLDHVEWLGHTRELIAQEKAGIFRRQRPVVCGDFGPPVTLIEEAKKLDSPFFCQGQDFHFELKETSWDFHGKNSAYSDLPFSQLAFQNLAASLMAVELLQKKLPVSEEAVRCGIKTVSLPGRIEIQTEEITTIFDVAHNPAAVAFLAERLRKMFCPGKKAAIFSMLADKDVAGSLREIKDQIDEWYVAPLKTKRAASLAHLRAAFQKEKIAAVYFYESIEEAQVAAWEAAKEKDFLLVFGSFHTVAEVRASLLENL